MKQIIICILLLVLNSCNGQKKEEIQIENKKSTSLNNKKVLEIPIDFSDKKYQQNGFSVPDDLNGDLYPSYGYFDKSIGSFSVNYIGKNYDTQYLWNIDNPTGFFSKYNIDGSDAQNSLLIKQAIKDDDYYIIADFIPAKYIEFLGGQDEEFDIKDNARTFFYLYENGTWIKIGEAETKKIPERVFQYYIKIIQCHKKSIIPKEFQRKFFAYTETEATTTGMGSISYYFNGSADNVKLTKNTYHETINCEGEYVGNIQNNILKLFYVGDDMNCISIEPKFSIKMEKDKYLIKGVGGERTNNQWLLMNNENEIK
ncbi:hypothetical protein ACM39_03980 [Chryseobacterium sp. FH2]|uniref:hypothetical protein n=1 Tax=Chryseobacterium sp. FH2 TaxID=1674291 RepID=UPI00065AD6A0|nr:hypothetical protein [Chryseobacterium sp. FH2]KMQ69263.1 hypothetical protein ACM39_03980 [Chryseobacterium sp. FH2]